MADETPHTAKPAPAGPTPSMSRTHEYTLDTLAPLLGAFPENLRALLFHNVTEAELWKRGRTVRTEHILQDAPLFLGSAYDVWQALTDAQRKKVNLDPRILAVCLDESRKLRELGQQHGLVAAVTSGGQAGRKSQAQQALRELRALRRSLLGSLRDALAAPAWARARQLAGKATRKALADGSERLADHVAALVRDASEDEQLQLCAYNIVAERAAELQAQVANVRAVTAVAASPAPRVQQRKLDIQDGRVLLLMARIYRAFRAAQRENPAILLPEVRALAGILTTRPRSRPRKARPTAAPPTPPSDAGAPA
ncbi:MAG TPA: hypothetical protein VH877_28745 [Polyangia bacterium]|jgi:hypothetical protein|nr:hypothetical protein [Polyangia bacterium]